MKALSTIVVAAVLSACDKPPATTEHYISVRRELREDDNVSYTATLWDMSVDGSSTTFGRSDIDPQAMMRPSHHLADDIHTLRFAGCDGSKPASVFTTFLQWTATAKGDHVEPFSKRISSECTYSYTRSEGTLNDTFTSRDVAKFSELLKQLPDANAERAAKQSKAEQEAKLFK